MTTNHKVDKNNEFKINLFDLPHDRFFIKINDNLKEKLVNNIKNKYSSITNFCNKLNLSFSAFYSWINKNDFSLIVIHKLIKEFKINEKIVEKNLIGLKSGYFRDNKKGVHSKLIYPKFPIKLTKELARIIAHFFGDGVISIDKYGYITSAYYNQNKILRENFKEDIKKIFGINKFTEGINKTTNYISLSAPLALILLHKIDSFNSKNCKIPEFIKNSNKPIKKEFLKAFFDDEASVRYQPPHRYIEITLNNKEFVEDLKLLLDDFKIKTTKIHFSLFKNKFEEYTFYIKGFENIKRYYDKINFYNNNQKDKLEKIINDPGRIHYSHGETKDKIINLLNERNFTSTRLMKILNRKRCTINHFLGILKKENKVKQIGKRKKTIIWSKK